MKSLHLKSLHLLLPALLTIALTACGGGGGGGASGTATAPVVVAPTTPKNTLFVGDRGNHTLAAFTTLTPAAGTNVAANTLGIGEQQLWLGMAYDGQRDRLYAANGKDVSVFEQASALNGNIAPSRHIALNVKDSIDSVNGMAFDRAHDRLYVGYTSHLFYYFLAVLDNVSTLNGTVTPARTIALLPGSDFAIDSQRGILYNIAPSGAGPAVYVFKNLDQINGMLPTISAVKLSVPTPRLSGLALDAAHDRLYIGVPGVGVATITGASSMTPQTTATPAIISLANTASEAGLAFDTNNDRLYAGLNERVYILNSASQLSATSQANALLITAPAGSQVTTFAFP